MDSPNHSRLWWPIYDFPSFVDRWFVTIGRLRNGVRDCTNCSWLSVDQLEAFCLLHCHVVGTQRDSQPVLRCKFDHCLFLCFKIHSANLTVSAESTQRDWLLLIRPSQSYFGLGGDRSQTLPLPAVSLSVTILFTVNGFHFTGWVAWSGRCSFVLICSLWDSHYIKESWLAEHQVSLSLLLGKLFPHRVRKTRDTGHLAVYLWEVYPWIPKFSGSIKGRTGVYFCFTNFVTKKKSLKRLFRKTHSK